jgi:H+/gluconate symporter-like permease
MAWKWPVMASLPCEDWICRGMNEMKTFQTFFALTAVFVSVPNTLFVSPMIWRFQLRSKKTEREREKERKKEREKMKRGREIDSDKKEREKDKR